MLAFEIKFKKASGVRYTAFQLADVDEWKTKQESEGERIKQRERQI